MDSLDALARRIRRIVIEQSQRAGVGHIGSALSVSDLLAVLYGEVLSGTPGEEGRDRFILSKGHAALALYAALACRGHLSQQELEQFCSDGTALGAHPEHRLNGIEFSTGSLGHGLSLGAGAALAARMQGSARRTFVILSDAELNEGSVWEAVMFAAHHHLESLTAIVDLNGQQALGYTREILDLSSLAERFSTFGWRVREVDGHDHGELLKALARSGPEPTVILAHTTFGKGVSFMESRIEWHYLPMTDAQFARAITELDAADRVAA